MISDLYICRTMGWTYDDLLDLPVDIYGVLVDALSQEAASRRK